MNDQGLLITLRQLVLDSYATLKPNTAEEKEINHRIVTALDEWFSEPCRTVSIEARYAAKKFFTSEMDWLTPGQRGMGRVTEYEPRFAAKYRSGLKNSDLSTTNIQSLFHQHMFLGYLFVEYLFESYYEKTVPRPSAGLGIENTMFTEWVPLLYSEGGAPSFDAMMTDQAGESQYWPVKSLWMESTLEPIKRLLKSYRVELDDESRLMMLRYFDAGIAFRLIEAKTR